MLNRAATITASPGARIAGNGHVRIEGVSITYRRAGIEQPAVLSTSLEIMPGEFVCILGPSGCGKSTLLNAVAGHVRPTQGRILVDDRPVLAPGPEHGMSS